MMFLCYFLKHDLSYYCLLQLNLSFSIGGVLFVFKENNIILFHTKLISLIF